MYGLGRLSKYVLWRTPGGSLVILPRERYRPNVGTFVSSHRTRTAAERAADKIKSGAK